MSTSRAGERPNRAPQVDQVKSTEDVFEHVIRGVRLSRLRELLRRRKQSGDEPAGRDLWIDRAEPSTA
jgi:hypothetical protein